MTLLEIDGYTLDTEDRYTVERHGGVAFYLVGPETAPDEDTEWTGMEEPTGRVICIMVGDDREWSFDPSELTAIAPTDYCRDCGQVGCTSNVYE